MWRMIKADIAYNRTLFIILYGAAFVAIAANAVYADLEEPLSVLMFFSVVVIGIVAGVEEIKTKRTRFFSGLPLPARQLGILRFPVFAAYWLSLMVLLCLSSLVSQQGHLGLDYFWWILTRTGAMFIMVGFMDLSQDLPFCVKGKVPGYVFKGTALLLGTFGGPLVYFATNPRRQSDAIFKALSKFFMTSTGATGLFLISFCIMALSIWVYEKRKSYTE